MRYGKINWVQWLPDDDGGATIYFSRPGRDPGRFHKATLASELRTVQLVEELIKAGRGHVLLPTRDDKSWVWSG